MTDSPIENPGLAKLLEELDPREAAELLAFRRDLDASHPGLAYAKMMFLEGRRVSGDGVYEALVNTRRRFATPGLAETRRRLRAAREGLISAGIRGVGHVRWTVDKPDVHILAPEVAPLKAVSLVEDAMEGFITGFHYVVRPTPMSWFFVQRR